MTFFALFREEQIEETLLKRIAVSSAFQDTKDM